MEVAWGQAFQIGGTGFGTVFLVLIILAGAISLVGLAVKRIGRGKEETGNQKKED